MCVFCWHLKSYRCKDQYSRILYHQLCQCVSSFPGDSFFSHLLHSSKLTQMEHLPFLQISHHPFSQVQLLRTSQTKSTPTQCLIWRPLWVGWNYTQSSQVQTNLDQGEEGFWRDLVNLSGGQIRSEHVFFVVNWVRCGEVVRCCPCFWKDKDELMHWFLEWDVSSYFFEAKDGFESSSHFGSISKVRDPQNKQYKHLKIFQFEGNQCISDDFRITKYFETYKNISLLCFPFEISFNAPINKKLILMAGFSGKTYCQGPTLASAGFHPCGSSDLEPTFPGWRYAGRPRGEVWLFSYKRSGNTCKMVASGVSIEEIVF